MSAARQILKNFQLFVDGRGYAGNCEEFQPPELAIATEDFRSGGMDAPIKLDMGMEALEATFKLSEFSEDVLKQFGIVNGGNVPLVVRGALQDLDGTVKPTAFWMRGSITNVAPDAMAPGSKPSIQFTVSLTYYRHEINGTKVHEIDIPNMVRMVNGVDVLAQTRAAIGM